MLISRDDQSEHFLNSDIVNDDFICSIVERKINLARKNFKVLLVLIMPAITKTENYMSNIFRVKIKIQLLETNEKISINVVLKVLLAIYEMFGKFGVFERECIMYKEVIPSFEKIWLEKANEAVKFVPQLLKIKTVPYEILVMEDLFSIGFEMLDRKLGMTLEQAKFSLTKLAKLHAASAVRYQKDGILHNCLDRHLSKTDKTKRVEAKKFGTCCIGMYNAFVENLRKHNDCQNYVNKIASWDHKKLLSTRISLAKPMKCGLTVLTHGDYWLNNLMFKYNESNEIEDVQMLDFQSSAWGSPTVDLHGFLTSSVRDDIKVECYDELIEHYYVSFSEALFKLKFNQAVPSLQELYDDLLEKSSRAIMALLYVLLSAKYESSEDFELDYLTLNENKDQAFFDKVYGNNTYINALKVWLPFFDDRGYLDCMLPDKKVQKVIHV